MASRTKVKPKLLCGVNIASGMSMALEGEDSTESKTHMDLIRSFFFFFYFGQCQNEQNVLTRKATLEFIYLFC